MENVKWNMTNENDKWKMKNWRMDNDGDISRCRAKK